MKNKHKIIMDVKREFINLEGDCEALRQFVCVYQHNFNIQTGFINDNAAGILELYEKIEEIKENFINLERRIIKLENGETPKL